eukprot:2033275-Pleurochrysis_carterae.AAC.1
MGCAPTVSGIVRMHLYPRSRAMKASAMPVLPLVGSTSTVLPGVMTPAFSAWTHTQQCEEDVRRCRRREKRRVSKKRAECSEHLEGIEEHGFSYWSKLKPTSSIIARPSLSLTEEHGPKLSILATIVPTQPSVTLFIFRSGVFPTRSEAREAMRIDLTRCEAAIAKGSRRTDAIAAVARTAILLTRAIGRRQIRRGRVSLQQSLQLICAQSPGWLASTAYVA